MNPATPRNIILDLGEVIVPLDFGRTFAALKALGLPSPETLLGEPDAAQLFRAFELGDASVAEMTETLRRRAPAATDDALHAAFNAMLLDIPPARAALLDELTGRYRLFLFSNTNALHHAHVQAVYARLYGRPFDSHFEKAYYSHLIGRRKPDVEAFRHIIADAGIDAAETLFIDDLAENIKGAEKAGLRGHHLTPGTTILDLAL